MSFSSVKTLIMQYLPISKSSFSDSEKEAQIPLGHSRDLERASQDDDQDSFLDMIVGGSRDRSIKKKSFVNVYLISDTIIGLLDGIIMLFALTISPLTLNNIKVMVFGGLTKLIASAILIGLGGYLSVKSEKYIFFCL